MSLPVTVQPVQPVLLVQPGQIMRVAEIKGHRDWNSGLFDCFSDIKTLCFGYFCISCMLSTQSNRLGESCFTLCCVPNACITMRTRIRTLGGIQGSILGDCAAMTFCFYCTVCQMDRELDAMGL